MATPKLYSIDTFGSPTAYVTFEALVGADEGNGERHTLLITVGPDGQMLFDGDPWVPVAAKGEADLMGWGALDGRAVVVGNGVWNAYVPMAAWDAAMNELHAMGRLPA